MHHASDRRRNWVDDSITDATDTQKEQLKGVLRKYQNTGTESAEKVGRTGLLYHTITLEGHRPRTHAPQRLSPSQEEEVRKQLDLLLTAGKI